MVDYRVLLSSALGDNVEVVSVWFQISDFDFWLLPYFCWRFRSFSFSVSPFSNFHKYYYYETRGNSKSMKLKPELYTVHFFLEKLQRDPSLLIVNISAALRLCSGF